MLNDCKTIVERL